MRRCVLVLGLVACGGSPPPAPPPTTATAPPASAAQQLILATVNGDPITEEEVLDEIPAETKTQIEGIGDPELRAYALAEAKLAALDVAIGHHLLVKAAKAAGLRVTDAELDTAYADFASAHDLSIAELDELLVKEGTTLAKYRSMMREVMLAERFVASQQEPTEPASRARPRLIAQYRAAATIQIKLELPPTPRQLTVLLDAKDLITIAEVEQLLKRKLPAYEQGRLSSNDPRTSIYDSIHLRAKGLPETNDLAVRVWRQNAEGIQSTWAELEAGLPNPKPATGPGSPSRLAIAPDGAIHALAWQDRAGKHVVLVTCGKELCKSTADLTTIANFVDAHLDRVKLVE